MFTKHTMSEEEAAALGLGEKLATTFNRQKVLLLQYTKLVNYFSDELDPEWGGDYYLSSDAPSVEQGLKSFMEDTGAYEDPNSPIRWIARKHVALPWGPDNFKLQSQPAPELGAPYEPYLALNGGIVTVNLASRILCVDAAVLIAVKCKLIFDEKVVAEAVTRLLKPRPTWARVVAKKGRSAKTVTNQSTRS